MPINLLTFVLSAFLKASWMSGALCFEQHMMRCSEPNAFKSWKWVLACFSGLHHKEEAESCECSLCGLKCTAEYTENVGYLSFPSLRKLTVSIIIFTRMLLREQHHIQTWGVHCQVILVEGLALMDLQSFCSPWVWCSQCANDLATLLSTTHFFLHIIDNTVFSWVHIFQLCHSVCLINYKSRQGFTVHGSLALTACTCLGIYNRIRKEPKCCKIRLCVQFLNALQCIMHS